MTTPTLLDRWVWVALSMGIAILASLARYMLTTAAPEGEELPWQRTLTQLLANPWLIHTLRLLYAVGLPAAILFWQGALTTRGMGLQPLPSAATPDAAWHSWENWAGDIGWATLVVAIVWLVLTAGNRQASPLPPADDDALGAPPDHDGSSVVERGLTSLREAVYHQVHWAFYREPAILTWGLGPGAWAGAALALVEMLLNPTLWSREGGYARTRALLLRVALLIAGTLLHLLTQNLWLIIAADALLGWALGASRLRER